MKLHSTVKRAVFPIGKWSAALLLSAVILGMGGCFHSTKVYTIDKTVVYRDQIFNVSNIKVFSADTQAVVSATETIPLKGMDKKQFNNLLQKHNPLMVRQSFQIDDKVMVYQAQNVTSWSAYEKMNKQFQSAGSRLTKFLADKKATQLKLK